MSNLVFTLKVTGNTENSKVNIEFDFDPPVKPSSEDDWDTSTVGYIAGVLVKTVGDMKD